MTEVIDTEAPPATHVTPPRWLINSFSASKINSGPAFAGTVTLKAGDTVDAGRADVMHEPPEGRMEVIRYPVKTLYVVGDVLE